MTLRETILNITSWFPATVKDLTRWTGASHSHVAATVSELHRAKKLKVWWHTFEGNRPQFIAALLLLCCTTFAGEPDLNPAHAPGAADLPPVSPSNVALLVATTSGNATPAVVQPPVTNYVNVPFILPAWLNGISTTNKIITLQTSTNLVNWSDVATNTTLPAGATNFTVRAAQYPAAVFRLKISN